MTNVSDESIVGLSDGTELCNIARLARSHLNESKLMLLCEAKEGKRDANMIIEVALGEE